MGNPTDSETRRVRARVRKWQQLLDDAFHQAGALVMVPPPSGIPEHLQEYIQEAFDKGSKWLLDDAFQSALELAGYPPGFWTNHPTNLFYRGPGIAASDHGGRFDFACPECGRSDEVIVRSSEWSVSLQSGDARGVFKAECTRCQRSFGGGFQD